MGQWEGGYERGRVKEGGYERGREEAEGEKVHMEEGGLFLVLLSPPRN